MAHPVDQSSGEGAPPPESADRAAGDPFAPLSDRFMRAICDHVAHPIFVKDREYRFVFVNRALCEMVGHSAEDLIGRTDYDFFPREQADFFREKDRQMFESGVPVVIDEEPITDASGRRHVLATTKVPLRDETGRATHLVGIIHDISDLKRAEEEQRKANLELADALERLRQRNASLHQLDQLKTEFLANISHEFRTPLTLSLAPLEEMLEEPRSASDHQRMQLVHKNSMRLLNLVNNLLDFARIESGHLEPTFVPVPISDLTRQLSASFELALSKKGIRYEFRDELAPGTVAYVDPEVWQKIIFNLLGNALKYTQHGRVGVRVRRAPGDAEAIAVSIEDTGIGMPEAELSRVFDRFHRVKEGRSYTYEGMGIGLSLVAEGVRLHGGTVHVKSELGAGSVFTVTIPLGSAHLPQGRIRTHQLEGLWRDGPRKGDILVPSPYPAQEAVGADATPAATRQPLLLVVDDNQDMRDYLQQILKSEAQVLTARDGLEGLEQARRLLPDLVISDVMMPNLDGFELCQRLKAEESTAHVPVLLITARADLPERVRGLQSGADDYILKPFNPAELQARVRLQLRLHAARQQLRDHAAVLERTLDEKSRALRHSHEELSTILAHLAEGVLVVSPKGELTLVNHAAIALTGISTGTIDEWAAQVELSTEEGERLEGDSLPMRRALAGETLLGVEMRLVNASTRQPAWVLLSAVPLKGERAQGAVCTLHDISRLKESERLKDEFLSVASHELRTPLGSLQLLSGVVRSHLADTALAPTVLPLVERQQRLIQRLNRLINDILDVSRLKLGKLSINPRSVELGAIVREAVERARGTIGIRHELVVSMGAEMMVHADPDRVDQILGNLLANACKYSPAGTVVEVATRGHDGMAHITVRDSGPGIPVELHERIFERFYQVEASMGRAFGGLGLGLYISRELATAQGGQIWVESVPEHGSTFHFTLPLSNG